MECQQFVKPGSGSVEQMARGSVAKAAIRMRIVTGTAEAVP
jgi:hypothetical protein